MMMTFVLSITTAAWNLLSWLKKGIDMKGRMVGYTYMTSRLRIESNHFGQNAKRCKTSETGTRHM